MSDLPDFDERMTTINCDESGDSRLDVYIRLSTVKGFKQKGDKEAHADLSFVNPCGLFEITDMPLSQLRILIRLLQAARKDWSGIELEDYQVEVGGCSCGAKFYTTEAIDEHICPLDQE